MHFLIVGFAILAAICSGLTLYGYIVVTRVNRQLDHDIFLDRADELGLARDLECRGHEESAYYDVEAFEKWVEVTANAHELRELWRLRIHLSLAGAIVFPIFTYILFLIYSGVIQ